jgi:hypothetical protein
VNRDYQKVTEVKIKEKRPIGRPRTRWKDQLKRYLERKET